MNTVFTIVDVIPVGDPDSGEAHIVTLHHGCKEGNPVAVFSYFGRFRAGKTTAKCPECLSYTTVIKKNGGDIFVQGEA